MRKAFTLAEVLIVLAVIGVIAALTIPTLMAKWREQATVVQVKKVYSILNQAYGRIIAASGEDAIFQILNGTADQSIEGAQKLASAFSRYMVTAQANSVFELYEGIDLTGASMQIGANHEVIYLRDGTAVLFVAENATCNCSWGTGAYANVCAQIDVFLEPSKAPHYGINAFTFYLTQDGVIPMGGKGNERSYENGYCSKNGGSWPNGFGCAAWIIENGNMDYPD